MNKKESRVLKVQNKDGEDIYLKTTWKKSSFDVAVLAGDTLWSGQCSAEDIVRDSNNYLDTPEGYFENAKACLTKIDNMHQYELQQKENSALFLWKIYDGKLRTYGSLRLFQTNGTDNTEVKKQFLDYLIDKNIQLENKLHNVVLENGTLQTELAKALDDMQKITAMKDEMECSLYGKFVQLLNSKKKRIELLEQSLKSNKA